MSVIDTPFFSPYGKFASAVGTVYQEELDTKTLFILLLGLEIASQCNSWPPAECPNISYESLSNLRFSLTKSKILSRSL